MKVAVRFIITLALALLLVWGIRTYVFTVFSVPMGGFPPSLQEGDRVIVNRMDCKFFKCGEMVVYADSVECYPTSVASKMLGKPSRTLLAAYFIGRIVNLPGDTIKLDSASYIIPKVCCKRCGCADCRYYLVRTSCGQQLVHKHQIIGKAYKLF